MVESVKSIDIPYGSSTATATATTAASTARTEAPIVIATNVVPASAPPVEELLANEDLNSNPPRFDLPPNSSSNANHGPSSCPVPMATASRVDLPPNARFHDPSIIGRNDSTPSNNASGRNCGNDSSHSSSPACFGFLGVLPLDGNKRQIKSPFIYLYLFVVYIAIIWPLAFVSGFLWIFITPFASITCNCCNKCIQNFFRRTTKRLIQILLHGSHEGQKTNTNNKNNSYNNNNNVCQDVPQVSISTQVTMNDITTTTTTTTTTPNSDNNCNNDYEQNNEAMHEQKSIKSKSHPLWSSKNGSGGGGPCRFLFWFLFTIAIVWPAAFLSIFFWVLFAPIAGLLPIGYKAVLFFKRYTLTFVEMLGGEK